MTKASHKMQLFLLLVSKTSFIIKSLVLYTLEEDVERERRMTLGIKDKGSAVCEGEAFILF